jgi:hypothetical protein
MKSISKRDYRLDLFRGLALLCILFDHIPGTYLSRITLKNYGFCDAAEVFVLIAGISSARAYAYSPNDSLRLGKRICAVYGAQVALLLVTAVIIFSAYILTGNAPLLGEPALSPFLVNFWNALLRVAIMDLQPEHVDILPLYVAILIWLLFFLRIAEQSRRIAFVLSFAVWATANLLDINIPGYRDGGWYFNPFAWQFLLSIGVLIGLHAIDEPNPRRCNIVVLVVVCSYLAFAFVSARPWAQYPVSYLKSLYILPPDLFGPLNKSYLSPWRLLNVLALAYIASVIVPRSDAWIISNPIPKALIAIGRLPLTSFVAASLLSTTSSLILPHFNSNLHWNLTVSLVGAAVLLLAVLFAKSTAPAWRGPLRRTKERSTCP